MNAWKTCVCSLALAVSAMSVQADDWQPIDQEDHWESFNRGAFAFNDTLDTWILKPAAQGYDYVVPDKMQSMVGNFFSNLGELRNMLYSGLQLEGKEAATAGGRFLVNSTVGMLGLLDVAGAYGMEGNDKDFGLVLADWKVSSGPFVMVPFFGPNTVRSGVGLVPDHYAYPVSYVDGGEGLALNVVRRLNQRSGLLKSEDLIVGDKYSFIRDAWLQNREYRITGELPVDDF
ncbi:MlaA family lipoprotein [Endozoicomonadaceae bacterium StTr2]